MKSVSAPLLSLLLVMFGNTYFMSFLAIKMKMDGHDAQAVGNLSSAYFLGFVIGAFIIEKLIERIGHIRSFTLFAALTSALAIAMGLYVSPWFWMLLRLVNGICVAGIYVVVESWLVTLAGKEQRGRALALYMLGLYLAQTLSQQILEYFDPTTLTPFCAMAF
ncbi:MAG: MFS family permease, partial [Chlamydiales bacterium]